MDSLEEKKQKILLRINNTLKFTSQICREINSKLKDIIELNNEIDRTIDVHKIWKDKIKN